MPSPSKIFVGIFTLSEITTMQRELATVGLITSLTGAAKSSGFARLDPLQQGIELAAAKRALTGQQRAQKVQNRLIESGYDQGGTITE